MPRYGYHGNKAGICYRTEVGAKIRAPKEEGILIVKDSGGYYWRLDMTGVYEDETVVAIRKDGKWKIKQDCSTCKWEDNIKKHISPCTLCKENPTGRSMSGIRTFWEAR